MVAGRAGQASGTVKRGISWVLFVIVVPILFACLLLAGALQVLGFPIVHDAMQMVGLVKAKPTVTQSEVLSQKLQTEKMQFAVVETKEKGLETSLQASQNRVTSLESQIQSLQKALSTKHTLAAGAKAQAQMIASMNPQQAALVVAKMPIANAARVIAAMSTSDAGPVLAQMDPAQAAKIMAASVK